MGTVHLALGILLAVTLPAAAQETRIAALNFAPEDRPSGTTLPELVNGVAQLAPDLRIQVLPGGAIAPFRIATDLRQRQIDLASLAPLYYRAIMPMADALELIERSPSELRRNGAFDYLDKLHGEAMNVHLLGLFGIGARYRIYLRDRRIERLSYENVRLLAPPNAIALAKKMEALLMQMPPAEVPDALERGVIEGLIVPSLDVAANGWAKLLKFKVDPGFNSAVWVILMNRASWNALSAAHRDALARAAETLETVDAQLAAQRDAQTRRIEEAAGVTTIKLGDADAATLVSAARDIGWESMSQIDPEIAKRLRKLLAK